MADDQPDQGWHRRRLHLKPGMTGRWRCWVPQVPLHDMVTLDYLYVANWSCGAT